MKAKKFYSRKPKPGALDTGEVNNMNDRDIFEIEERRLKLRNLKIDLWIKPLSFLSVLIAFSLALFTAKSHLQQNQKLEDERLILEEKIETSHSKIGDNSALLIVNVELINRGGEVIKPYAHAQAKDRLYLNEGLYFVIYEIQTQPNRMIDSQEGKMVYGPINILEKYSNKDRTWYESYKIKPHTTYHESEAIILERKKLYQVLARFFVSSGIDSGWTITESRYVYID
ncbi:hypothetical protein MI467_04095 [Delftia acidovorans]|uniref:hypothetical protein n=1 Tax=Delftia acidovorans TaxID=80866 RepID=UPI001EFDD725|nr:hypothetical protein [Delftia acidovorans]MCG8986018.1 hypothetical protein [Delftia acidovorans]